MLTALFGRARLAAHTGFCRLLFTNDVFAAFDNFLGAGVQPSSGLLTHRPAAPLVGASSGGVAAATEMEIATALGAFKCIMGVSVTDDGLEELVAFLRECDQPALVSARKKLQQICFNLAQAIEARNQVGANADPTSFSGGSVEYMRDPADQPRHKQKFALGKRGVPEARLVHGFPEYR